MSPYNAFDNNPVFWADPSGADAVYNWDTGKYMDGNKEVSFQDAMASHGMNTDGSSNEGGGGDGEGDPNKKKSTAQLMGEGYARGYSISGAGYAAAMNGGDPYNPTEADEKEANDALFHAILFISGEFATVKIIQGGSWVIRTIKASNILKNAKYINLASSARVRHIIEGDASGGGHAWFGSLKSFWNGLTGKKSMFPITWSNDKIMHAISDVATNNRWVQQTGTLGATHTKSGQLVRYKIEGVYNGVKMRVITTADEIITAFPIN
jgi:hypothetical protein